MENKNEKFLKKYFAEEDRQKQLGMMKDYMLSLNLEELIAFSKEQTDFLGKALKSPDVSDEIKMKIFDNLDEMIFLLKGKVAA